MTKRLIDTSWTLFKYGAVLALVAGLIAVPYLQRRINLEIHRQVQHHLASHLPHLKVALAGARLIEGQGIEIRGLSIVDPAASGAQAELAHVDEALLRCDTDLEALYAGRANIAEIVLRRAVVRVARGADGRWNVDRWTQQTRAAKRLPRLTLEDSRITVVDALCEPARSMALEDVNLVLASPEAANDAKRDTESLSVQGSMRADSIRRIELRGALATPNDSWTLSGALEGLEISPVLAAAVPREIAEQLQRLGTLRAEAQVQFAASYDPRATPPFRFQLDGRVAQGHIDDARLPLSLSEVQGSFHADNDGFAVHELTGRNGETQLWLTCRADGYDEKCPLAIAVKGGPIALEQRLMECLPAHWRDEWHKFLPAGHVAIALQLNRHGGAWRPTATVECQKVAFTYHAFPYRLERSIGTLELKDDTVDVNLRGFRGDTEVHVRGRILNPGPHGAGWLEIWADRAKFDEALFSALDKPRRGVLRSFNPRGTFNLQARLWSDPRDPLVWHQSLVVGLNRCSARFESFPYPLENIRGTVESYDDAWVFRDDLAATNGAAEVICRKGSLAPTGQGCRFELDLAARHVPLDEDLRQALSAPAQRAWNDLKPHGTVGLAATIRYESREGRARVWVRAEPEGDTTSIEPRWFPYPLDKLQGALVYHDGHVQIDRCTGRHGPVHVTTRGRWDLRDDGGWQLELADLAVDRLTIDREVTQVLPEALKNVVVPLKVTGPISLRGRLGLTGSADSTVPVRADWNMAVDFHQGGVDAGIKLDHLHGGARLVGGWDGARFQSSGELRLDSVMWHDVQFTEVRGPIWIDERQVLLGAPGGGSPGAPPRHVTAQLFGGTLVGDGRVMLGEIAHFALQANLTNADLARCAGELFPGRQALAGKIMGNVALAGNARGQHTLTGGGHVRLIDANLYELPQMVALLKTLSFHPPDTTAFTTSDIDFRIGDGRFQFDRIDFKGDAISLKGRGEMDFDRDIRLAFYAVVGRDQMHLPIVGDLFRGASQQIMRIRAEGNLSDPEIRRETFPAIGQAIQQLQTELSGRADRPRLVPPAPAGFDTRGLPMNAQSRSEQAQ